MTTTIPTLPRAWLGYAAFSADGPVVRVCSWCPDAAQADAEAARIGHAVTHTICPQCYAKEMERLRLD